jgi:hypothetical protein
MLRQLLPVLLLTISNIFMTFAWYGHLKYKGSALWIVILVSWGIAFLEYCFQVPANRIGHEFFSAAQLKTNGWGKDFSGWQRFITPEESVRLAEEHGWDPNYPISGKINIEYLDKWKVAIAATKLNAKQFTQYLRDYGVTVDFNNLK